MSQKKQKQCKRIVYQALHSVLKMMGQPVITWIDIDAGYSKAGKYQIMLKIDVADLDKLKPEVKPKGENDGDKNDKPEETDGDQESPVENIPEHSEADAQ